MHISSETSRHFLCPGSPVYKRPPVDETVLGIQFNPIPGFSSIHYGTFHELIRDEFPHTEDQAPLPTISEKFPKQSQSVTLDIGINPLPRIWYMEKPGGHSLIQLQRDRIIFNWRKMDSNEEPYPSYEQNAPRFIEIFNKFVEFIEDEKLGKVEPNLCEVIYVNHLKSSESMSAIDLLQQVLVGRTWDPTTHELPLPEASSFNRCFVINDNLGRLYAEAATAYRENEEAVQLKLTARVIHKSDSVVSICDTLEIAHNWVVNGFADLLDSDYQASELGRIK